MNTTSGKVSPCTPKLDIELTFLKSQSGVGEDVYYRKVMNPKTGQLTQTRYYVRQKSNNPNYVCWLTATKLKPNELATAVAEYESACPIRPNVFMHTDQGVEEVIDGHSGTALKQYKFSWEK
jgi:hypothetical protein